MDRFIKYLEATDTLYLSSNLHFYNYKQLAFNSCKKRECTVTNSGGVQVSFVCLNLNDMNLVTPLQVRNLNVK